MGLIEEGRHLLAFQFQSGAINRLIADRGQHPCEGFQFQSGAINSYREY